jgi:hypothetical protein
MENLRRQLHKGTEICSSIELLGIGEAVRETEEEVEETLLFSKVLVEQKPQLTPSFLSNRLIPFNIKESFLQPAEGRRFVNSSSSKIQSKESFKPALPKIRKIQLDQVFNSFLTQAPSSSTIPRSSQLEKPTLKLKTEATLSFKHVEGTEALDMTEVEVTNAEAESVLLGAFSSLQITS